MTEDLLLPAEEIRRLREAGEAITVVDARGSAAYRSSGERVAGDLRLQARDIDGPLDGVSRRSWILAYCTCLGDGLAVRAAERLRRAGHERSAAIRDGLDGARRAGLDIVPKAG